MTIRDYLSNPTGKENSSMMLGTIRHKLDSEFRILQHAVSVQWYIIPDQFYVAHLKIPSASYSKVFYDVVLEFDIASIDNEGDFRDKHIRVFSNCPSFTFTYARVFYQKGMLITWLVTKYDSTILGIDPDKRNPDQIINYEKSLYFAFRYLNANAGYYRRGISSRARAIKNTASIIQSVKSSKEILRETKKKKEQDRARTQKPKKRQQSKKSESKDNTSSNSKKVKKTKMSKKVTTTKKSKRI